MGHVCCRLFWFYCPRRGKAKSLSNPGQMGAGRIPLFHASCCHSGWCLPLPGSRAWWSRRIGISYAWEPWPGLRSDVLASATAGRGEHKLSISAEIVQLLYQFHGLTGQGNHMVEPRLHALGIDVPFGLIKVDFIPPPTDQLAGPVAWRREQVGAPALPGTFAVPLILQSYIATRLFHLAQWSWRACLSSGGVCLLSCIAANRKWGFLSSR